MVLCRLQRAKNDSLQIAASQKWFSADCSEPKMVLYRLQRAKNDSLQIAASQKWFSADCSEPKMVRCSFVIDLDSIYIYIFCLSACPFVRCQGRLKWNVESKFVFVKMFVSQYLCGQSAKLTNSIKLDWRLSNMLNPNFTLLSLSYVNLMLFIWI